MTSSWFLNEGGYNNNRKKALSEFLYSKKDQFLLFISVGIHKVFRETFEIFMYPLEIHNFVQWKGM